MKKMTRILTISAIVLSVAAVALPGLAQTTTTPPDDQSQGDQPRGGRVMMTSTFGSADFAGGYLKYTYQISREGTNRMATTTTEITPQADGTYTIASSSTETVPLAMVHIGFFGIALPMLGVHVPESGTNGTIDLSPLSYITKSAIEPGKEYVLPDGGHFQAGSTGTIASVGVVYGTYTHADYANVVIQFAFATDLTIRGLMPFPAMMEFRYTPTADQPLATFSLVKLTEFVYRP